jgi:hypothetical protein
LHAYICNFWSCFLSEALQKYRLGKQFHREGSMPETKDAPHGICLIERQWQLIVSSLRGFILSVCACLLVGMTECTKISLKIVGLVTLISSADAAVRWTFVIAWNCYVPFYGVTVLILLLFSFVSSCAVSSDGQGANAAAACQSMVTPKSQNPQEYGSLLSLQSSLIVERLTFHTVDRQCSNIDELFFRVDAQKKAT